MGQHAGATVKINIHITTIFGISNNNMDFSKSIQCKKNQIAFADIIVAEIIAILANLFLGFSKSIRILKMSGRLKNSFKKAMSLVDKIEYLSLNLVKSNEAID
jgi:hypothetical protein